MGEETDCDVRVPSRSSERCPVFGAVSQRHQATDQAGEQIAAAAAGEHGAAEETVVNAF
mgnify:CR=1 FL=1